MLFLSDVDIVLPILAVLKDPGGQHCKSAIFLNLSDKLRTDYSHRGSVNFFASAMAIAHANNLLGDMFQNGLAFGKHKKIIKLLQ